MDNPEVWRWIWLIAIGVFAGGELILAGSFFLLPFAGGALAATIVAFAEGSIAVQWAAFVIVSALGAAGLIPLRKRLDLSDTQNGIGARRLIDQEAVVEVAVAARPRILRRGPLRSRNVASRERRPERPCRWRRRTGR